MKNRDRAVCGVVKNAEGKRFLMAAGGRFDGDGISHKMTEVLDLQTISWAQGEKRTTPLRVATARRIVVGEITVVEGTHKELIPI